MVCKFRRYKPTHNVNYLEREDFTCHEVRKLKEYWLKEFREKNLSDIVKVDPAYEAFKNEIEEFLSKCKCRSPFYLKQMWEVKEDN